MEKKPLRKRQRLFIEAFTDKLSETCGNATKSAEKAGYSVKRAASQGSILLNSPHITQEIARLEKIEQEKYNISKEDAIKEARERYVAAEKAGDKTLIKYWHNTWLNLQSWLVARQEINTTKHITTEEVGQSVYEHIQNLRSPN